jgi:hypothetical protein
MCTGSASNKGLSTSGKKDKVLVFINCYKMQIVQEDIKTELVNISRYDILIGSGSKSCLNQSLRTKNEQNKLCDLSPRANYTDRATTACRRS